MAVAEQTLISYAPWSDGMRGFRGFVRDVIDEKHPESMCEIGGGARPLLPVEEIASKGLSYTVLDISQRELDKAPAGYVTRCADAAAPGLAAAVPERFDLIQSYMLAEHVADPAQFHRNVYDLLTPGGTAIHFIPTLYEPAFVFNRCMPSGLTSWLLPKLQPHRLRPDQQKFPAYYRWCRGPSAKQIGRLEGVGFRVVMMRGYFGTEYAKRIPPVDKIVQRVAAAQVRRPHPAMTSFCLMMVQRPV